MYKVMLVDDEYMILEGLKQIIPWEELGFEIVKTAKRGQAALEYLQENSIDLLITDVTMPKMSGIDLVREVRQFQPNLAVLILSGYQEFDYVRQGMELGVKGYLLKPINKEELEEKVQQIKVELSEQEKLVSQKEFYYETMIQKWLNDEINEDEFFSFVDELNVSVSPTYSVMIINLEKEATYGIFNLVIDIWILVLNSQHIISVLGRLVLAVNRWTATCYSQAYAKVRILSS